jgi:hypothetical protein
MALREDLAGEPGKYEGVITAIDAFNAGRSVTIHPFAADIRADGRSPDQLILVCGLLFYCSMEAAGVVAPDGGPPQRLHRAPPSVQPLPTMELHQGSWTSRREQSLIAIS